MCGSQRASLVQTVIPLTTTTHVTTQEHKFSGLWMAFPELQADLDAKYVFDFTLLPLSSPAFHLHLLRVLFHQCVLNTCPFFMDLNFHRTYLQTANGHSLFSEHSKELKSQGLSEPKQRAIVLKSGCRLLKGSYCSIPAPFLQIWESASSLNSLPPNLL